MMNMALCLEAQRYYRFLPAFVELETRCLREGYRVADNLRAFCDSLDGSGKLADGATKFYGIINSYGYRLRDFSCDFLRYLDTPTFHDPSDDGWNCSVRPKHEWDNEPWEDEVRHICEDMANPNREEKYLNYERRMQAAYRSNAMKFGLT